jgi:molecular chaperone IbpA|tara:strand:+ start:124 stop:543 length:420 start_codon:yes stop_codon:yes gene_type:complete
MNVLSQDIKDIFYKMSVGFDDQWLFTAPTQISNYPPYNLSEDKNNNSYRIDMAVAGFSKDELEIFEEDGKLTISGKIKNSMYDKNPTVVHYSGLAQRGFTRNFNVAQNIKITKVTLENGVLSISFLKEEHKSRKTIKIE